jgi:tetratricopeptide (TPR) repeat protein
MKSVIHKLILVQLLILISHSFVSAQLSRVYENGAALFTQKDYEGSKTMMNRVIKKSEYYFEAYTIRARCHEALGNVDSALIDFNKALEIKPDFLPAIFFRGVLYYNQKSYEQAITDFTTILAKRTTYINALIYRGRCHEALGHKEEAIQDYTTAINLKLKNHEVYYRRGLLYEKERLPKDAIWDYTKAVEMKKDFVEGYLHRGMMYVKLGKDEEALKDFEQVIELTDTIREVYRERGDLYYKQQKYDLAAADYTHLIQTYRIRRDWNLFLKRADAYFLDSNYREAYKEYSRVLQVNPRYDRAVVGQAKCRMMEGKPSSAMPLLVKALSFNPNNYEAWYLKGRILYDKEDFEQALKHFDQSLKFGSIPAAWFYRGSCKFETGDKYGACIDLKKSVELGYNEEGIEDMVKRVCR